MSTSTTKLLTVTEVAERLGLKPAAIYQLSYQDRLPGRVKIGARVRWRSDAIDAVVRDGLPPVAT